MGDSPEAVSSVHNLVQLGRTLGIETLAEGIEQSWQLASLQDEHCRFGQGSLFSQPIAPEAWRPSSPRTRCPDKRPPSASEPPASTIRRRNC